MSIFNPVEFSQGSPDVTLQYLQTNYYNKTSTNNLLSGKLNTSGGTITGSITCSTGSTYLLGGTGASFGAVFSDKIYISDSTSSTSSVRLSCPTGVSSYQLILPPAQSTSATSSFLMNNGSGALSWVSTKAEYQGTGTLQTVIHNTNVAIQFPSVVYVNGSSITASNTNSRFTNSSGQTVYVYVSYSFRFTSPMSGTISNGSVLINGTGARYAQNLYSNGGNTSPSFTSSCILQLASNDYFEVYAFQFSGISNTISSNNTDFASILNIWQLG